MEPRGQQQSVSGPFFALFKYYFLSVAAIRAILSGRLAQAEILLRKSLQFAGWRVVDF
jgi:hypothetical protein